MFRSNGKLLGKKLQVVAQELSRAAAILQDEADDSITIFDEIKKNLEKKQNSKLNQINWFFLL